ncbi:hypothetical protein GUITHDRAFT_116364 [Guillardia theta CCMP2712]|uniref:Uncharacterized protein n=3 Tax=Guillardia theta TaxID=55529 RepID=L1IN85_GUITC|nr:hypothetical protein GUITHDRAFT_116364 [Guillardia theta CCMP2712]EKX37557.1 hypothetical protein GUITHDRAFT_116364 [Guillardia theta CCMP2712]|eukprot:XP_005824537.1 hypothetical protein GUITHDRAFT_116364 [Guillardia theta CCMP2712]
MFTEDRETNVRAMTFSILSSISSCMTSSNYISSHLIIASQSSLVLAPQHSEYLEHCMEKVLDPEEAEYVRYQASMVLALSLSDTAIDIEDEDETLDVLSSCSMRTSESLLLSSDSLQDSTRFQNTFDNVEISNTERTQERDAFAKTRILNTISILERSEFLHFFGKLISEMSQSAENKQSLLLMACVTIVYNWSLIEPVKVSSFLSDDKLIIGVTRLLDPMLMIQTELSRPRYSTHVGEALVGSNLHLHTVTTGSIPCMLHGVSVLCKMLTTYVESNEEVVFTLVHKSSMLESAAKLLRYRFSNQAANNRCSNLAWIHRHILNAELVAKTSLTSLLCSILSRGRTGFEASRILMEQDIMDACLSMLLPCYHPSLNYSGCALLSHVSAHISDQACKTLTQAGKLGEESKFCDHKADKCVERELSKRLLGIYHQLYESSEVENISVHLNVEQYKGAVVAAICSILSASTQSKEFCLSVGFPDALVSALDARLNQMLLYDLHGKNNLTSRIDDSGWVKRSISMTTSRNRSNKTVKKKTIKRNLTQIETEIVFILEIFKNLLYNSSLEIKSYLLNAGLPNVISRLLTKSCSQTDKVVESIMQMLANLVFECEAACQAMADGRSHGMNLLQLVMNSMGRVQANSDLWQDYMRVLSSSCSSWECLLILLKSRVIQDVLNRIDEFTESKCVESVAAALLFLVSLSFREEGQVGLLRIPQFVELLARTRSSFILNGRIRHLVGLLFRNLTFLPAGKAHILNHAGAMEAIIEDLEMSTFVRESSSCRAIAANAVWSLLYLHEKSRTTMKTNGFSIRIQRVYESLASSQDSSSDGWEKSAIESLQAALKILDV